MKIIIRLLFVLILALEACAVTQETGPTTFKREMTNTATAPKYSVGDKWTFKSAQGATYILKVVEIESNGIVTVRSDTNCRQYRDEHYTITKFKGDACGFTLMGGRQLDFPLFVGKSWRYTAQGENIMLESSVKVITYEKIAIAAGSIETFKLESTWFVRDSSKSGTTQYWYAPSIKQIIKLQSSDKRWDYEMVSFSIK